MTDEFFGIRRPQRSTDGDPPGTSLSRDTHQQCLAYEADMILHPNDHYSGYDDVGVCDADECETRCLTNDERQSH